MAEEEVYARLVGSSPTEDIELSSLDARHQGRLRQEPTLLDDSSHGAHLTRPDGIFADDDENIHEDYHSPSIRSENPTPPTAGKPRQKNGYDDFSTIDWMRDATADIDRKAALGSSSKLKRAWNACQGWIIITLVGAMAGVIGGILNITIAWLNDIKLGVCKNAWYLSIEQCCWAESLTGEPDCADWYYWSDLFNTSGSSAYAADYFMYLIFAATFSGISALLVKRLAPYAAGSGLAEIKVILGGFIIRGYFGFWTLVVKTLGIVLALASGLNVGNEGPMIHISLCLGNVCTRIFKRFNANESKRREILSAAAAIGIAAAFNAPVGGVLYSLEEVSYYFPHKTMWRAFFGCLVAAVTLSYMNPLSYSEGPFDDRPWHWFEMPAIILLGGFGGLYGAIFCYLNVKMCAFRKRTQLGKYPITEVISLAVLTGVVGFPNHFAQWTGHRLLFDLFKNCDSEDNGILCTGGNSTIVGLLFATLVFKCVTLIVTIGLKAGAHKFCCSSKSDISLSSSNPNTSFVVAACLTSDECVTPSMYAMVGATAVLAGVSRMTVIHTYMLVALVIIMFELTGGLKYILPFMVSAAVAKWVGDALHHEGIYDSHIHLNGFPYLDAKEDFEHYTKASDAMQPQPSDHSIHSTQLLCVAVNESLGAIEKLYLPGTAKVEGFPVVTSHDERRVVGYVDSKELKTTLDKYIRQHKTSDVMTRCHFQKQDIQENRFQSGLDFADIVYTSPFEVPVNMPMANVIELFRRMGMRFVLVTNNGHLVGIITKKDVLRHIAQQENRHTNKLDTHTLTMS